MQLTTTEYQNGYDRVLAAFCKSQENAWAEAVYKVRKNYDPRKGKLLYLYLYALDSWTHSDTAENILTEDQVMAIIQKANQVN